MKTNWLLLLSTTMLLSLSFSSCDKDDDHKKPEGTVSLNMLNEDNGKTLLGESDIYIDKANNFSTSSCLLASLGKKAGIGSMSAPQLSALSSKAAVEPGTGYQAFRVAALRDFPSGKSALHINADYYNVYVTSPIKQEEVVVGANVSFTLMQVPTYDLPEFDTSVGNIDAYDEDFVIELPTSDFECEPLFASEDFYKLNYEKKGNKIIVRLVSFNQSDVFGFYIRVKGTYTYIYGTVRF